MQLWFAGEVIISQEPYVFVPNNSLTESSCDGCFSKSNLKKCSACQVVWYCGSTCQVYRVSTQLVEFLIESVENYWLVNVYLQKLEWKLHRLECQALAKLDKERRKSVTPTIRMMVKLYLRRKLQSERVMGLVIIVSYVTIISYELFFFSGVLFNNSLRFPGHPCYCYRQLQFGGAIGFSYPFFIIGFSPFW